VRLLLSRDMLGKKFRRMRNRVDTGVKLLKVWGGIALSYLLLVSLVLAEDGSMRSQNIQLGDCVKFEEGGAGLVLRTPVYWLTGTVASVFSERRRAGQCPDIGKAVSAYKHEDWIRVAAAMPCVGSELEAHDVEVTRLKVIVEAWETPWSNQHGAVGWLFRGKFLETPLKKGEVIEMDTTWLKKCDLQP